MRFHSRCDSADVFNEDFPHPATGEWTQSSVKIDEDDNAWTQTTHGLFSGEIGFPENSASSIPLRHFLSVDKTDGWIATHYKLDYRFQGREAFRKYPEFARQITGVSSDSTQWISEALTYIVSQGMEDIQTAQKNAIDPDLVERIQNHMRGYFSRIKEKDLFEELNQDFLQKAFSPFIGDVPKTYIQHLAEAMAPYEEELRITSGLTDDEIRLHVFLPGAITSHNADSILGDTLQWTFGLEEILNDDYKIRAASIVYSPRQIQAVILGITALILLVLWIAFKSRKRH